MVVTCLAPKPYCPGNPRPLTMLKFNAYSECFLEPAFMWQVLRVAFKRLSGGRAWRSARLAVWSSRAQPHGDPSHATRRA